MVVWMRGSLPLLAQRVSKGRGRSIIRAGQRTSSALAFAAPASRARPRWWRRRRPLDGSHSISSDMVPPPTKIRPPPAAITASAGSLPCTHLSSKRGTSAASVMTRSPGFRALHVGDAIGGRGRDRGPKKTNGPAVGPPPPSVGWSSPSAGQVRLSPSNFSRPGGSGLPSRQRRPRGPRSARASASRARRRCGRPAGSRCRAGGAEAEPRILELERTSPALAQDEQRPSSGAKRIRSGMEEASRPGSPGAPTRQAHARRDSDPVVAGFGSEGAVAADDPAVTRAVRGWRGSRVACGPARARRGRSSPRPSASALRAPRRDVAVVPRHQRDRRAVEAEMRA